MVLGASVDVIVVVYSEVILVVITEVEAGSVLVEVCVSVTQYVEILVIVDAGAV